MTTFENSRTDYVRFAIDTVDTFVAGNGRPPSMDFVMTHLRHTSLLFGHKVTDRGIFSAVACDLRTRFPALDAAAVDVPVFVPSKAIPASGVVALPLRVAVAELLAQFATSSAVRS